MRKHRARLLALALVPLAFLALELGLRLARFDYPPLEVPIVVWNADEDQRLAQDDALHRADAQHFWLPREGAAIPWAADERVTRQGFRGADPDPTAPLRIALLGDSSTFGWGLAYEQTFARLLERRLEELARAELGSPPAGRWVQVLDAGVVGSTVVQGTARYRQLAPLFHPHVVVEAFGAINEQFTVDLDDRAKVELFARRGAPLARAVTWLRTNARVFHAGAWLVDQRRGGRDSIVAEDVKAWRTLRRARREALPTGADLETAPTAAFDAVRVSPDEFDEALEELLALVRADGARLVCLAMPRARTYGERYPLARLYDPKVAAFAARNELVLVDAGTSFRTSEDEGVPELTLFQDGIHPTAAGAERLADLLFEALSPLVRELLAQER